MPLGTSCDDGDPNTLNDQCTDQGCQGCAPDCVGKSCGDDGCGGVCGSCGPAGSCQVDQTCDYDLSCEDILSKDPTAPTGPYTVDPDGAGPAEAKGVYCDMSGPVVTYEDVAVGQYNASYAGYELLSLADLQDAFIQEVFTWAYNAQGGLTNLMVGIKPGNCCFKEGTPGKYIAFGAGGRLFPCEGETPLCNDPLNDAVVGFRAGFPTACSTELSSDYFATHPPLIESGCDDANNPGFFLKKSVAQCVPLCTGKVCGDDGCGGSCGSCATNETCEEAGEVCVCQPECSGKVCGDDGCGGLCGTCASNESCEEGGEVCVCQPSCSGKVCGDDGCGGLCGTCASNESCEEGGEVCVCQPSCSGISCGSDGCGGSCGSCSGQDSCVSGQCVCQPSCSGKTCGSDGCGGSCGSCSGQDTCVSGACVCQPDCSGKVCGDDGCGGVCGTCAANESCEEDGQVCSCQPECTGKSCGDDGCGGQCGLCTLFESCVAGQCFCEPDCTGKVCGGDGCGGSCGTCASDLVCSANQTMCECYDPICPPLDTTDGLIEDAMAGDSYCISDIQYKQCVDPGNGQCPEWTWSIACNWDDGLCIQYGSNHDCGLE